MHLYGVASRSNGMNEIESVQHSNIDESDMGQLHSIHLHLNAIAAVQRSMPTGHSLFECIDCGDEISEARRLAAVGCTQCIHCKAASENPFFKA